MKNEKETTALVTAQTAAETSRAPAEFTREQIELVRRTIAKGCSDDELALFLGMCQRSGLDPFSKQAYFIRRWDSREKREVAQFQLSIDAFRLLAARTHEYLGAEGPFWTGADGVWHDAWIPDEPPVACKMGVWRAGYRAPLWAVARFSEYCQLDRDGNPAGLWKKMPAAMISKCCEALALRRAFPAELSNAYSADEMAQADRDPGPPRSMPPAEADHEAKPQPESPAKPWTTFRGMLDSFSRARGRLRPADDRIYHEVLKQYGAAHSNEFKQIGSERAIAAYRRLLERVQECEDAYAAEDEIIDAVETPPEEEAVL